VLTQGRNLDQALIEAGIEGLDDRDRSLAAALAYGAVRTHLRNQRIIELLVDRPFRSKDSVIVALISVGLFALTDSRRPDYAVVSATVAAAPKVGRAGLKGVVNALLRRFLRERDELLARAEEDTEALWLHPRWLIDRIRTDWPSDWQEILHAGNRQAPMWLRINLARTDRQSWLKRAGPNAAAPYPNIPSAVMLTEPSSPGSLPGFHDGECSVQDIASQAAAFLLDPQPGMRVLDACAAPGGKASHLLEYCSDIAELVALDQSAARLQRVEENFERIGLRATVKQGNVLQPEGWWDSEQFDRILLDAPCSATGVIRRHPDIRFLRQPDDIESLAERQYEMLQTLWPMLRPGGLLLYSTCSLLRAENQQVIARFVSGRDDVRKKVQEMALPGVCKDKAGQGLQLLPGRDNNDGFYYALMERCRPG